MTPVNDEGLTTWPLHEHSEFIEAAGLRWHVQRLGQGPVVLLIHGTGASTHSWRDLARLLSSHFEVVMCDLPGHGYTELPGAKRLSLPGMSRALKGLIETLAITPRVTVGHSAGAAVLLQMVLDDAIHPDSVISINGALMPWHGIAGHVFSPLARLLALNPLVPRLVSWRAGRGRLTEKLLADTGSKLSREGIRYYERLLQRPDHVAGTLGMMANWDLDTFAKRLPQVSVRLTLVVGDNDRTVSPQQADRVKQLVPGAEVVHLPGLGHLAHEEAPDQMAELVRNTINQVDAGAKAGTG